ncbi:hypothetical protein BH09ACT12_BH09ACT12_25240 [soil metagenome]
MGLRSKKSRLDQATDVVEGYVDSVRPHVQAALESAMESTRDFVQDTALPALSDAKDKAGPVLADARDKAAPIVAEARVKAAAQLADARDKAAPVVAAGAAAAGEKANAARVLADAKVAELKGEKPKKKSKLKRVLVLGLVAGGLAFAAKKLQGGGASDNWQSSYVPTPAPAPAVDDTGGASPDEALADEAEAPHPVTTPEEPAEVIEIDPEADTN